ESIGRERFADCVPLGFDPERRTGERVRGCGLPRAGADPGIPYVVSPAAPATAPEPVSMVGA
ncbi:hypothetical protein ACFXOQ_34255, partial [Streptomyces californicus]|uniref:hypothetical protein n=1 Tax=Streptomyces californicus TaxID=67351 RepID=UPI003684B131